MGPPVFPGLPAQRAAVAGLGFLHDWRGKHGRPLVHGVQTAGIAKQLFELGRAVGDRRAERGSKIDRERRYVFAERREALQPLFADLRVELRKAVDRAVRIAARELDPGAMIVDEGGALDANAKPKARCEEQRGLAVGVETAQIGVLAEDRFLLSFSVGFGARERGGDDVERSFGERLGHAAHE